MLLYVAYCRIANTILSYYIACKIVNEVERGEGRLGVAILKYDNSLAKNNRKVKS